MLRGLPGQPLRTITVNPVACSFLRAYAVALATLLAALLPPAGEAASSRHTRGVKPAIALQDDGSYLVTAGSYRAIIGVDGNLHSLQTDDMELLDDKVGISLGAFFYSDAPKRLPQLRRIEQQVIEATDGTLCARYEFRVSDLSITLQNRGRRPAAFFAVLSPALVVMQELASRAAAAAPANEAWGGVRAITAKGSFLELRGGTRVWGPWLDRQVWEAGPIAAGGSAEITLKIGRGDPPVIGLPQLVEVRATVSPAPIVPAGEPVELTVSVMNRSDEILKGTLALEMTATRTEAVVYTTSPLELGPRSGAEAPSQWRPETPDFYTFTVTAMAGAKDLGATRAVAGYNVAQIVPQAQPPADLAAFWRPVWTGLQHSPPDYTLTPHERLSTPAMRVQSVEIHAPDGAGVNGWYVAPAEATRRPAVLLLPGYGSRVVGPPLGLAARGWVALAIDPRGNRVDRAGAKTNDDILLQGAASPETYVYYRAVANVLRALQFLRFQQEVDPERIAIVGVSEGAGLGIIAAALSPAVKAVVADSPLLADFPLSAQAAAWPYPQVSRLAQKTPDRGAALFHTLSYFDTTNHAPQVRCPVLLSVGLLDRVALPSAVYGLYNMLPGPKEIKLFPKAGHEGGGEAFWSYKFDWLAAAFNNPAAKRPAKAGLAGVDYPGEQSQSNLTQAAQ